MTVISIEGLDKSELLAAFFNNARPQGQGFTVAEKKPMTKKEAAQLIANEGLEFDYLQGRVMKIELDKNTLDPRNYDRNNGEGVAAKVVEAVKNGVIITLPEIPTTQSSPTDKLDL